MNIGPAIYKRSAPPVCSPPEKISGWHVVERVFRMQGDRKSTHRQQTVPALLRRGREECPLPHTACDDMVVASLFSVSDEVAKEDARRSELETKCLLKCCVVGEELAQHARSPGQ